MKSLFQTKSIHCGDKVQSTKQQSAGSTLRGRSWRHVNHLLPPEASMCHGLGCSVKNWDLCETGCQSQHKCVHQWHFCPCLTLYKRALQNLKISPSNRTVLPLTPQTKPKPGAETIPAVLEQGIVASFIAKSQPNELQCLVHLGNWGLSLTAHKFGVFKNVSELVGCSSWEFQRTHWASNCCWKKAYWQIDYVIFFWSLELCYENKIWSMELLFSFSSLKITVFYIFQELFFHPV